MNTIWQDIDRVDSEYVKLVAPTLNVDYFNKLSIISHSTIIEGSTLTLSEAFNLIEKGTPATGKHIDHHNMVLDHYEALEFVLQSAQQKAPITVDFIRLICAKTMRRTGKIVNSALGSTDESSGDLRKVNVSAGGHFFVDQTKVPSLLRKLADNISHSISSVKTSQEIYTLAFEAHFDLVSIHPFTDGNGRTSRLLMNCIEAYHNKPLTIVQSSDKAIYFDTLNQCSREKSTQPIINFLAGQHITFLTRQIEAYSEQRNVEVKSANIRTKNESSSGYSLFY